MTGGSKIIGMWRDRGEEPVTDEADVQDSESSEPLELNQEDHSFSDENQDVDEQIDGNDWHHYSDENVAPSTSNPYAIPAAFALAIAGWTGFFLWANSDIFTTMPTAQAGITLITQWCLPVATLAVLYLIAMRNSTREASRFADVSASLRVESNQLETRLKTINNELSIAREFLAGETRELEFLGDQSSQKLKTAAARIKSSLEDGLASMNKLDDVGESAFKNLEQLREHLPVVINTAKDVTNQIGNSGRAAQSEMAAMVATLKRVADVGTAAKKSLDELNERSDQSLGNLSKTAEEIRMKFGKHVEEAENSVNRISTILKDSSSETIENLHQARAELAKETSNSSGAIKTDLESLKTTLSSVTSAANDEETRLKALITELDNSISDVAANVENLDNESGEKTAKLAFAMTALEQNSTSLQQVLENGHSTTDKMIERMETLITALDSSARGLDETLPAAFERVTEKSEASLALFGKMKDEASQAGETAGKILEEVAKSDQKISLQRTELQKLKDDGASVSETIQERISALSQSLKEAREENEALTESAGEKLIGALLRVKETAKQASEHSREALENSIAGSAEKFEQVSEEALNRIIDEKIASIAPKLEDAVAKAVASTQSTAGHLTEQLTAIEEMTTNLEQRILFAKEKAEQSSDENFTRRVALLTESLNSTAIDVTKLLSNEVTDTEWAAYLKGDRGIFTRRAVRLLDAGEVREILLEYEGNSEFREHVNRYIHDFEAMLRGVLSTRDGSAISVTLLSSDIGKLYVALAQAIERLRT